MPSSSIADPRLARAGRDRIEWADAQMPVLRSIRDRFESEKPMTGVGIAACLHVTAETANLLRALAAAGARVALCAANPLSTQDDVAASLRAHYGVEVRAAHGESAVTAAEHLAALVASEPQITLDDGADLVGAVHDGAAGAAEKLLGALEETTTGLLRLRAMHASGRLRCPVVAVNEAQAERIFSDRYGTGQSTLDGILRAANVLLAGQTFVVLGYGWTGQGIALRARGAGASVIVCEVDPLRALEARMEGFEVMPALKAAERGDVFVTVSGNRDVLRGEHFRRMKDGAVLANAGHFDVEINLSELAALAVGGSRAVRPLVEQFDLGDRRLNLLTQGRVVNLAAAEGHPAAVMDVSFAIQALTCEHVVAHAGTLPRGVHSVPDDINRATAMLKLAALGVEIDELSEAQKRYQRGWAPG